ncbi:uncharacterized protein LOC125179578 [Hyalella azteca]|uniref:Uncharacterized protein LOC125179578 n=1 Tax=Hyalella azteca TaxID=294128 RepID=A0A979FWL7_HYAAZ|nr:uncharacterized protein LOC125179578 [Hyalella azteca]
MVSNSAWTIVTDFSRVHQGWKDKFDWILTKVSVYRRQNTLANETPGAEESDIRQFFRNAMRKLLVHLGKFNIRTLLQKTFPFFMPSVEYGVLENVDVALEREVNEEAEQNNIDNEAVDVEEVEDGSMGEERNESNKEESMDNIDITDEDTDDPELEDNDIPDVMENVKFIERLVKMDGADEEQVDSQNNMLMRNNLKIKELLGNYLMLTVEKLKKEENRIERKVTRTCSKTMELRQRLGDDSKVSKYEKKLEALCVELEQTRDKKNMGLKFIERIRHLDNATQFYVLEDECEVAQHILPHILCPVITVPKHIREENKTISSLPNEMLEKVFSYISLNDMLVNVLLVNKRWNEVGNNSKCWTNVDLSKLPCRAKNSCGGRNLFDYHGRSKRVKNLTGSDITDGFIKNVVAHCPNLRSLKMLSVKQISEGSFATLAKSCPSLHRIQSEYSRSAANPPEAWIQEACQLPSLREFYLCNRYQLNTELVSIIATNGNRLQDISANVAFASDDGITEMLVNLKQSLRRLHLLLCEFTPEMRRALHECKKLFCLNITAIEVPFSLGQDHFCAHLTQLTHLDISLSIFSSTLHVPVMFRNLVLPNVTVLSISKLRVCDTGYDEMVRDIVVAFPKLRVFTIAICRPYILAMTPYMFKTCKDLKCIKVAVQGDSAGLADLAKKSFKIHGLNISMQCSGPLKPCRHLQPPVRQRVREV